MTWWIPKGTRLLFQINYLYFYHDSENPYFNSNISKFREYAEKMPFAEAVETAVEDCIRNGILADFLLKNRAEAIEMSIFEYDEEKHLKNEREYAYKEGKMEGIRIVGFILKCNNQGDSKEEILQKLQESYSLSEEEAEAYYLETENSIAQNR